MELKVNVQIELGEKAAQLLGFLSQSKGVMTLEPEKEKPIKGVTKEEEKPTPMEKPDEKPTPEKEEKPAPEEKPTRTRRTKAEIEAEKNEISEGWDGLSEEEQLDAIKASISSFAKKGKSGDIKILLGAYGVNRASEVDPSAYRDLYDDLQEYGRGVSVDDILNRNLPL